MYFETNKNRTALNLACAKELGIKLKSLRETKQLSVTDVADRLLLSRHQIIGLEKGESTLFYGAKLYAQAADKYANLLGLTNLPLTTLIQTKEFSEVTTGEQSTTKSPKPEHKTRQMSYLKILTLSVFVAFVATTLYVLPETPREKPEKNPLIVEIPQVNLQSPLKESVNSTPLQKRDGSPIASQTQQTAHLNFMGASWVKAVTRNGTKLEKTYRTGEELTLPLNDIQTIIIGNIKDTALTVNQSDIDLKAFTSQGGQVAKISGAALRTPRQ